MSLQHFNSREPNPCPLNARQSVLRPLALWCLDTFSEDHPMLVGIHLAADKVHFNPVQLSDEDPLTDLGGLAAPLDWDVLVVVATTSTLDSPHSGGTIAHAVDRFGGSATELDDWCGRRRSLHTLRGSLHSTMQAMFDHP